MSELENTPEPGGSLRALSPGYYPPTDADYQVGWEHAVVAVDASVLLSLYRYSTQTRDELLKLLESFKGRLWLPHQAAIEYERNRLGVIRDQVTAYSKTLQTFNKSIDAIRQEFSRLTRHPLLDQDALSGMTEEFVEHVTDLIEETRARHPSVGTSQEELLTDPTRTALEQLFEGRVGRAYTSPELDTVVAEAKRRLDAQEPPGYQDKDKPEPDCYGDYFFWRQALDRALEVNAPLLLLTDDEKDDWWWEFDGRTLGPRQELVAEFFVASGGRRLLMYTTHRFIEEANRLTHEEPVISAEAAGEVERLAAGRTAEYEIRSVACPFCDTEVVFRIGSARNHTALPTCGSCGRRFHAFHTADDSIGTRQPGVTRGRVDIECPSCAAAFKTILPASGRTKSRACFECGALMTIDDQGNVSDQGPAQVYNTSAGGNACPGCLAELRFLYRTDGEERTSCPECAALVVRPASQ